MIGTRIKRSVAGNKFNLNWFFCGGDLSAFKNKSTHWTVCVNQSTNCSLSNKMILVIGWPAYLNSTSAYISWMCNLDFAPNSWCNNYSWSFDNFPRNNNSSSRENICCPSSSSEQRRTVGDIFEFLLLPPPLPKRTHNRSTEFTK